MKITKLWARGYRSLREVELDPVGDFNVFYGPNGSGKSNVIRAVATLLRAVEVWSAYQRPGEARLASALVRAAVLHPDDRHRSVAPVTTRTILGIEAEASDAPIELALAIGRTLHRRIRLELTVDWSGIAPFAATIAADFDGVPWEEAEVRAKAVEPGASARLTLNRIASQTLWAVGADRILRDERLSLDVVSPAADADASVGDADVAVAPAAPSPIATALREGRLQTAIFHAKNDWDRENRARFEHLREMLAKALDLPRMDVGRDPSTGLIELRQPLGVDPEHQDISLRSAGLGVEQLVAIVASIVFARSTIVAVEEPEAHLHAPTTGRRLRTLLRDLVEPPVGSPRLVHQLFIATHSNLFDLDRSGYWDVQLVNGETRIERKELHELYAHHLYEPGPARLLLMRALEQFGEEVVFHTKDGQRIGTQEMMRRLDDDDPVAMEFVRDMHAAALAALRVRARRGGGAP